MISSTGLLLLISLLLPRSSSSVSTAFSATERSNPPPISAKKIRPRIPVVQYQDDWVCVNKPAGLTVHRSAGSFRHKFVLSTLLKRQLARKVFPVHRLDHRTSGAILFAFDSASCGRLQKSLTSEEATKQYVALLRGDFRLNHGEAATVDSALNVNGVLKEARTDFALLASVSVDNQRGDGDNSTGDRAGGYYPACSLVLCEPKTGRTHQIRRHAYALGHPVLGDSQRGDSRVNRWWRVNRGLDRLALHCLSLDLPPINGGEEGEWLKCVAPLSSELMRVLRRDDMRVLFEEAIKREPRLTLDPVDLRGGTHGRNYRKRQAAASSSGSVEFC